MNMYFKKILALRAITFPLPKLDLTDVIAVFTHLPRRDLCTLVRLLGLKAQPKRIHALQKVELEKMGCSKAGLPRDEVPAFGVISGQEPLGTALKSHKLLSKAHI